MYKNSYSLRFIDLTDRKWLAFIDRQTGVNIFHHPAWTELLNKCYGFRPFAITLMDTTETIHAGFPIVETNRLGERRWISLPFSDYCSPLSDDNEVLDCLINSLITFSQLRGSPKMEIRWDLPGRPPILTSIPYVRHFLSLDTDIEKVKYQIHHSHLRNVRIAQSRAVQIKRGTDRSAMEAFYKLHVNSRHKQGVPVQPHSYFESLDELIIQKGLGFFLLAYHEEKCLAGAVFLNWKQTLTYKYGASIEDGLIFRPNHLIFWNAIQWGCENGYSFLDFGRSDIKNIGLRTFKSRWGAKEIPLEYLHLPLSTYSAVQKSLLLSMFQILIRKSPTWMCRFAGEIYYRLFS
jgi:hypothetical protein